jgi:hypothetical protein
MRVPVSASLHFRNVGMVSLLGLGTIVRSDFFV